MTRQPSSIQAGHPGQHQGPAGYPDRVLACLRAEFPSHRISTESIVDRVRYIARRQHQNARPHTVITTDLDELRAALEAGRDALQSTVSR